MQSADYAVAQCVSVLSHAGIQSKRLNFFHRRVATTFYFFCTKRHDSIPTGPPNRGAKCRVYEKNRDFRPIYRCIKRNICHKMIQDRAMVTTECTQAFERYQFNDLVWLSEIFNDTTRWAVSLRQLSFLLHSTSNRHAYSLYRKHISRSWFSWQKERGVAEVGYGRLKYNSRIRFIYMH